MQAANNVPPARVQQPLPESDFVVEARESIPVGRHNLTTATRRGRAATATRGRGASTEQERGRGRGRSADTGRATRGRGTSTDEQRGRGRGRSTCATRKRSAEASTSGTAHQVARGRSRRGYATGPDSVYYMCFGDDRIDLNAFPDLNEEISADDNAHEMPLSQNAPSTADN
jgi:hypothetical protein